MTRNRRGAYRGRLALALFMAALVALVALPVGTSKEAGIAASDVERNGGCTCHSGSTSSGVTAVLTGLPEQYEGGQSYNLTVSVSGGPDPGGSNQGGFSLKASEGTLTPANDSVAQRKSDGSVTHTTDGNDQRSWEVAWSAPTDDTLKVKFNIWANAVDGDGQSDGQDQWNTVAEEVEGASYTGENDDDDTPGLTALAATVGLALVALAAGRRK